MKTFQNGQTIDLANAVYTETIGNAVTVYYKGDTLPTFTAPLDVPAPPSLEDRVAALEAKTSNLK